MEPTVPRHISSVSIAPWPLYLLVGNTREMHHLLTTAMIFTSPMAEELRLPQLLSVVNSEQVHWVGLWSVRGRYVVGTWSVRGRYVAGMWSVRGRYVVGTWSVCGRYVVGMWSVRGRYVVATWSVNQINLFTITTEPSLGQCYEYVI